MEVQNINQTQDTYALCDNGSAVTLIDLSLAKKLNLQGQKRPLIIEWTDGTTRRINDSITSSVTARGVGPNCGDIKMIVRTMKLDLPKQSLSRDDLTNEGINNQNVPTYQEAQPLLLIGLDNIKATATLSAALSNSLLVSSTPLGWTVEGMVGLPEDSNEPQRVQLTRISALHRMVERFIDSENLGIDPKRPILENEEIRRAREQLEEGTKRVGSGYQVGLLWKTSERPSFSNYQYTMNRLIKYQRTLDKNPGLRDQAEVILTQYEEKGYISRIRRINGDLEWFLPLFAAPGSSKVRLVFDAAAVCQGVSLNSLLSKGPDLNEPLWNVLYRFRQFPIAVCADVAEMYLRIGTPPEDRKFQRFLWIDGKGETQCYEMNVQTFGVACSPSIAQYVKNEHAKQFANEYPSAVEAIINDTYVDDLVTSFNSEEEALEVVGQVKEIQGAANFQLHKWQSNSKKVLDAFGMGSKKVRPNLFRLDRRLWELIGTR